MANYVEGKIALTGKYTDLKRFILQGLVTESNGVPPTLDEDDQCLKDTGAALLMVDTSLLVHCGGDDIPIELVRDDIYTIRITLVIRAWVLVCSTKRAQVLRLQWILIYLPINGSKCGSILTINPVNKHF
ncbi:hypothetical protein [Bacillus sp. 18-5]|uniref:hypothetical protein n=1 Tax=Bacillus sp. 18-5 TaxID=3458701 RepID=UPI00404531FB